MVSMSQEFEALQAEHFWLWVSCHRWQSESRWNRNSRALEQLGTNLVFFSANSCRGSPQGLSVCAALGLPHSMVASGQSDCLQGRAGLWYQCSREQGGSCVTFSDQASEIMQHQFGALLVAKELEEHPD